MAWNEDLKQAMQSMSDVTSLAAVQVMGLKQSTTFEASRYQSILATASNMDTVFTTGAKPVVLFSRLASKSGDSISLTIYRGPTFTGQVLVPDYCLNQVTPTVSTANAYTATVSAAGTQIASSQFLLSSGLLGLGGSNSSGSLGGALYLPANTSFLFRIYNPLLAAQAVFFQLMWYEGTL